jgi:DNA-binding HxlR family transcriptional regulator
LKQEGEAFLKSLDGYANLRACPIATGFKLLGKRWTIEIVRQLFLGDSKFNELLKGTTGINPRMLSLRLKELEDHGVVERKVFEGRPVNIQYSLTIPGRETIPVMFAMARFSMKNFPEEVFMDGRSRTPDQLTNELRRSSTHEGKRRDRSAYAFP